MTSKSETGTEYSLVPFFEQSPDPLCIAGFDGYFKKINPALSTLLEYSEQELLSRPINSFVHPDDQDITEKHRDNIREGKPLLNFENRYVSKNGKIIWLSWTSMPINERSLVYAIAKNITYRKKHEEQRNQLLSQLKQTNNRLKKLNYTTSHDLRSPVSSLLSVFSLLDTSTIKDEETRAFINMLKVSTDSLKKTLDNFVDDLRSNETLHVPVQDLEIPEVLGSIQHSLEALIRDSKTRFITNFEAFKTITFNQAYLESIFLNLITNSIKYAHPDRDPVITIETSISEEEKQLTFSDNGIGFDIDKQKDKVFGLHQKFHKHKDSKGIGLYLVYNHVTDLGGRITVDSKVDSGTTFVITFKS